MGLKSVENFMNGESPFSPDFRAKLNAMAELCNTLQAFLDSHASTHFPGIGFDIEIPEQIGGAASLPGVFPVLVSKDGGLNGTDSTPATFTYTVSLIDGTELATNVVVTRPRFSGAVTFQDDAPNYGIAFYDASEALILWDAGEIPDTTEECDD